MYTYLLILTDNIVSAVCVQALSCFVQRCYEVVKHVLQQMSALYVAGK